MFIHRDVRWRGAAASLLLTVAAGASAQPQAVYRDAKAPVDARVQDLLSRMTVEEKAAQLLSMWREKKQILEENGDFSNEKALNAIPHGIGQLARPSDTTGTPAYDTEPYRTIEGTVAFVNDVQRFHVEKTRLGIPALFHEETLHGYLADGTTIFPNPTGLGSTWDPQLIEQAYTVTAREVRVRGATVALGPVLDLIRDPRWGRTEEFFSEDPYLTAQMGLAAIRGHQGRMRPLANDRVFATLKHFLHGNPQGGINIAPAEMSQRTIRETFLVPFAAAIPATNPAAIMPSYNEVEGVPNHASVDLLQKTGRERLAFRGAYFSDYFGIQELVTQHHVAKDNDEAAILAMNAGVDADLPEGGVYKRLPELVRAGRIPQSQLDAAVGRVLAMKFEAGLFEQPYVDARRALRETNTPADIKLARTVAEKSLILLKNDGLVPLDPQAPIKLAVIGPHANEPMYGGYSGRNRKSVSILDGIKAAVGKNISVANTDGVWITERNPTVSEQWRAPVKRVPKADNEQRIAEAVALAQRSDVLLLVLGDSPTTTREAVGEALTGDRSTLGLFGDQDALVEAMVATGKPIVTLLINGRTLAVPRLVEKTNALFEGWYLGQEGGNAFANVLFGRVNPGGKLTVSVPRSVGELPAFYNRHPSSDLNFYSEGKRAPLFPFGYGLSYTTFELSRPRLSKEQITPYENFAVMVDITNTGKRAGDEVVQLYIRDDVSSVPRPILELKAFQRVTLQPGEKRTVQFDLTPDALAFWDINMKWSVEPGTFTVSVGNSSAALQPTVLTVNTP